jgi:hypothetical protein
LPSRLKPARCFCTDDIGQTVEQGLCARCLEPDELAEHGGRSLGANSGFFAARADWIGDYLKTWEGILDAYAHRAGGGFDQPGLNAAMLRASLPVCMARGPDVVSPPRPRTARPARRMPRWCIFMAPAGAGGAPSACVVLPVA